MNNLHIDNFQQPVNLVEKEYDVLDFWDKETIFEKSVNERPADKPYVFYDGPPFATGLPHYGHIVASTTKDVFPRYWTMKGYRVERKWGWDCHGLPVENIVEKELKLADKRAIEEYGIDNFNNACKTTVLRYVTEWKQFIRRLGRFVDMEHDYKTMEPWYMESLWWVFKELWKQNLIYKGHKSMHICPRCSTPLSNFEVTQGYKDVKDISVYVGFKLTGGSLPFAMTSPTYVVAWTTTPWTLPGNVLLAVNPEVLYTAFRFKDSDNVYIAAKERMATFVDVNLCEVLAEFTGSALIGATYEPLFPYFKGTRNAFRVVEADFVSLEDGSGVVHIAPAFGENDYNLGRREDIPLVQHVDMNGRFTPEVTDFAGRLVKPKDNPLETDIEILKYLQANGLLVKKQNIVHSYPHCWRCETPLINYATSSWFVKVTHIKDALLSNNQQINWVPDHIKEGRFGKWLEGARDWAISRNRYWGTPLPIWQSDDGEMLCIGSIQELETLSGVSVLDLHKHIIDDIQIEKDGKTFKRIPEVLDCWFESGAMPYASFHYPFEHKEKFEASFPAEFISEGQDQTRGWFYTLHVLATALTYGETKSIPVPSETSSFKNVIVNGIVLAEDGQKMSKSKQNYPDPMVIGDTFGMDALRLYLMSSPVMRAESLNFSEKGVEEVKKKVLNIIWNTFTFLKLYDTGHEPIGFVSKPSNILDVWMASKSQRLSETVVRAMEVYDVVTAARELSVFADDLSTWFLRLSRDRIKSGDHEAIATLKTSLYTWMLLAAPFTPFITELMYQNLDHTDHRSIHLELLASVPQFTADAGVLDHMKTVMSVVTLGHAARKTAGISLKQPLSNIRVVGMTALPVAYTELILQELNVKSVEWGDTADSFGVTLDTTLTPALLEEGKVRELIREIQNARKAAGTEITELVTVQLPDWPEAFESEIMAKVKANRLVRGDTLAIIRESESHV